MLHFSSYKLGNVAVHVKKQHGLKGILSEFTTVMELRKIQLAFSERYLPKSPESPT